MGQPLSISRRLFPVLGAEADRDAIRCIVEVVVVVVLVLLVAVME